MDARRATAALHPSLRPRQRLLARRIHVHFVYGAIRRAIRDCGVSGPLLMAPCGDGWYFDRLRRDGIEAMGMDIEPEAYDTISFRHLLRRTSRAATSSSCG